MKILVVEDNPADVFLIEEALRAHQVVFEMKWLRDGEQALLMIEQGELDEPDVVLLDLNLPRVDGKEVLMKIRQSPQLSRVPVVIMTSSDSPQDRREMADLGANCYIKKPPTLDEFLEVGGVIKNLAMAGAKT
jgi:two-component system, chemotaxis family, response regulator Rcp1